MNWEQIQGNWKQATGKAKEQWGKLTDDDLDVVAGRREQLHDIALHRDVGLDRAHPRLTCNHCIQRLASSAGHDHLRTGSGERQCHVGAHPAATTGDEHSMPGQHHARTASCARSANRTA